MSTRQGACEEYEPVLLPKGVDLRRLFFIEIGDTETSSSDEEFAKLFRNRFHRC